MAATKVCQVKLCPNLSAVRIADVNNEKRRDLCISHGKTTLHHFGEQVEIIDFYNGTTMEDMEDERNQ